MVKIMHIQLYAMDSDYWRARVREMGQPRFELRNRN